MVMTVWVARERNEARRQWHLAEALLGEARQVLDKQRAWLSDPGFSRPEMRRQREAMLSDLLASDERLVRLRPDDPGLAAGKSMTLLQIGSIREAIGPVAEAEAAYRAAVNTLEGLVEANPGQQQLMLELARGYNRFGSCLTYIGKLPDAERAYRKAWDLWARMPEPGRAETEVRTGRAETLNGLAQVQEIAGNPDRSDRLKQAAAAIYSEQAEADPGSQSSREMLARSYTDRGASYRELGMPRPALESYSRALELLSVAGEDPGPDPARRCWYAACLRAYGTLHYQVGSMEAAGPALRRSVAICRTLVDEDPENIPYRDILGRTLIDLGRWQREAGDARDADMSFREAINHLERLVRDEPGTAVHRIWLALGHANRGTLFLRQKQPREAEACHKRAIDVYRRALEKNPQDRQIRNELASTYANCPIERLRDPEEAVRLARENVRDDPEAGAFLGTLGIASTAPGGLRHCGRRPRTSTGPPSGSPPAGRESSSLRDDFRAAGRGEVRASSSPARSPGCRRRAREPAS